MPIFLKPHPDQTISRVLEFLMLLSRLSPFTLLKLSWLLVSLCFFTSLQAVEPELMLIKKSFNACVLEDLHSSGTLVAPSTQKDLGLQDLRDKYQLDPQHAALIGLRLKKSNADELAFVFKEVGEELKDNRKLQYVLDELSAIGALDEAGKTKAVNKLILSVKKWNPKGIKGRLIAAREARFQKQALKARAQFKKRNPALPEGELNMLAQKEALRRRERTLHLARSCSSFKANPDTVKAAKHFMGYNLLFSTGGTGVSYAWANRKNVQEPDWAKRLGYEVVMAGVLSMIYGKIAKNNASTFTGKVVEGNAWGVATQSFDAGVYSMFFSNDQDKALAHLEKLKKSPTFEADMANLNTFLQERDWAQKVTDGMGDAFGSKDLGPQEIAALKPQDLQNPLVMERLMDSVEDQLYSEQLGGNTWGNKFMDRLAFDLEWNLMPMGVPRGVLVGILSYHAVCRNIDNPKMALLAFGAIQVINRAVVSTYYYHKKAEEINQ